LQKNYTKEKETNITQKLKIMVSEISIGTPLEIELDSENSNIITRYLKKSIYTNPIKALIIEIVSNAEDAKKRCSRKCNKTLVSLFRDKIVIRDYGDGMSPEFISTRYRKMTNSTARDRQDNIGALGIGSKSPLAYTKEFYLNTISDGFKYNWRIVDNGTSSDTITLDEKSNTSEFGTEVVIPIKESDYYEFKDVCEKQLMYFDVDVFGFAKKEKSGCEIFMNEDGIVRGSRGTKFIIENGITILLGPVIYTYNFSDKVLPYIKELYRNSNLVLKFKTDELDFSLSRETLQVTDHNDKVISEKIISLLTEFWNDKIEYSDIKIRSVLELPAAIEPFLDSVLLRDCEYFYNGIGFNELMGKIQYCRYYHESVFLASGISMEDIKSCKKIGYTYKISEDLVTNMKMKYTKDFMVIKLSKLDKQGYVETIKSSFDCLDDLFIIADKKYNSTKNIVTNFNYRSASMNSLVFRNPSRMSITNDSDGDIVYIVQKYDCKLSEKMKAYISMQKLTDSLLHDFENIAVEQNIAKELLALGNNFITEESFFDLPASNSKKLLEIYNMYKLFSNSAMHEWKGSTIECLLEIYKDTPLEYFIINVQTHIPKLFSQTVYESIDELSDITYSHLTETCTQLKEFLDKRQFLNLINSKDLTLAIKECEFLIT